MAKVGGQVNPAQTLHHKQLDRCEQISTYHKRGRHRHNSPFYHQGECDDVPGYVHQTQPKDPMGSAQTLHHGTVYGVHGVHEAQNSEHAGHRSSKQPMIACNGNDFRRCNGHLHKLGR